MQRYSRRNQTQRHYRVAQREAALSPQRQVVKIRKNGPKILTAGLGLAFLICLKWFFVGYLVGKKND